MGANSGTVKPPALTPELRQRLLGLVAKALLSEARRLAESGDG